MTAWIPLAAELHGLERGIIAVRGGSTGALEAILRVTLEPVLAWNAWTAAGTTGDRGRTLHFGAARLESEELRLEADPTHAL